MRTAILLSLTVLCGVLHSQDGQQASRPGWPCVAGRAVDPAYLEITESTGGQLFLFQKGEAAQAAPVMSAPYTHPATILRAVGYLSGSRDLEFPVDRGVESLLALVSVQCRQGISVYRPSGGEATDRNSALSLDLAAGRILRIDQPEAGPWRLRLAGNGLFVVSVLAKSKLALTAVSFLGVAETEPRRRAPAPGVRQTIEFRIPEAVAGIRLHLTDASGNPLAQPGAPVETAEGVYRCEFTAAAERFRVVVTGSDDSAWPFQRTWPTLFRAAPPE